MSNVDDEIDQIIINIGVPLPFEKAIKEKINAKQAITTLIEQAEKKAIIKELKTMWNKTQEDIIPLGAYQSEEADYIQQRLKELEK